MDVNNCTGCSACFNLCPRQAVDMQEDKEGFLRPAINEHKCIKCGLCFTSCPVINRTSLPLNRHMPDVYVAWHRNDDIRLQSSSGGVFTALAATIINNKGVVLGAAFDQYFKVYHKLVIDLQGLAALRGSKYLESRIGNSYEQAKKKLIKGLPVLFSGTPCQIAGLYACLGKKYHNLFTCNLICKGIPSPKVFGRYLRYIEQKYGSEIMAYSFRDKSYGWAPNEAITLRDGKRIYEKYKAHKPGYYYAFASKALFCRPSCYQCPFKGLPSAADITLGDFWYIREKRPEWDDNKGASLVLVHSPKGDELIKKSLLVLKMESCPFEYISQNSNLMRPAPIPRKRKAFFNELDYIPFEDLIKKYMTPPGFLKKILLNTIRLLKTMIKTALRIV